jgi:hypothetical protein
VPEGRHLKLSQQIADQLAELGNTVGTHLAVLSHEVLWMSFDGRSRRAKLHVGGGNPRYLELKLASDMQFIDGRATIYARIDLAIAGEQMRLELPEIEMVPTCVRGERGVEVRLPLFRQRF